MFDDYTSDEYQGFLFQFKFIICLWSDQYQRYPLRFFFVETVIYQEHNYY